MQPHRLNIYALRPCTSNTPHLPPTARPVDGRMLMSSFGTEGQRSGNPVAHLHPVDECQHVSPFACRHWLLILGRHVSHLFERKAEFIRIDELSDQRDVLGGEAVVQPDEEASQNASDLLVAGVIHAKDRLRTNALLRRG
jgi:hypothetical protein